MKHRVALSFALALLVFGSATNARAERVWAFGDSLSDNGNLSLLFATDGLDSTYLPPEAYKPFFPPELGGAFPLQRISTGKTTTEYVAEFYGTVLLPSALEAQIGPEAANNFAIFGARAALTSPLDLPYQVAQLAGRVAGGLDVSEDRAIVLIGANDVFAAWGAAIEPVALGGDADIDAGKAIIDEAIDSLRSYLIGDGGFVQLADGTVVPVPSLTALGLDKFVVMNVPSIARTPWVTQTGAALGDEKQVVKAARKMTRYFNKRLKKLVRDMRKDGVEVVSVNIKKINDKVRRRGKKLGFTNRKDDCFLTNTLATLTQGLPPTPGVFRDTCGADMTEKFMFIDTAHPTGTVHRAIADRVLDRLP